MRSLFFVLLALLMSPTWALAHNVGVSCKIDGDTVKVEAYYDDNTAAATAKVQVVNAKKEVIANGITDDNGIWAFPSPIAGKYVVHLDAGAGHRAQTKLDVPAAAPTPKTNASASPSPDPTRSEFTRTPWLKISIGIVVIGGLCGAFLLASLMRKNASRG